MQYDAEENLKRLRIGLKFLMAGRPSTFSGATPNLIVVFNEKASFFSGGRVLLFQQFFLDHIGVVPQIIRQASGCIKVFFDIGNEPSDLHAVADLLNSEAFLELCRNLRIIQVSFRDRVMLFENGKLENVWIRSDYA